MPESKTQVSIPQTSPTINHLIVFQIAPPGHPTPPLRIFLSTVPPTQPKNCTAHNGSANFRCGHLHHVFASQQPHNLTTLTSISISLKVLPTLMIIIRLLLHDRNF
jgi:hypothetical protein